MSPSEPSPPSPDEATAALARLAAFGQQRRADAAGGGSGRPTAIDHGRQRAHPEAAVLVPLFLGRKHTLYVLLSRRSKRLRGYPGDTALPGGKVDPTDVTYEDTARREAHEEIGLAREPAKVVFLAQGPAELSREGMTVVPIIVFIKDQTLIPELNPDEVSQIFALPLAHFLRHASPFDDGSLLPAGEEERPYHSFKDVEFADGRRYRRHQFLTGREALGIRPVRGLTAAILINTAETAFGRPAEFQRHADPVGRLPAPGETEGEGAARVGEEGLRARL